MYSFTSAQFEYVETGDILNEFLSLKYTRLRKGKSLLGKTVQKAANFQLLLRRLGNHLLSKKEWAELEARREAS